jgi:hypothetical protein
MSGEYGFQLCQERPFAEAAVGDHYHLRSSRNRSSRAGDRRS